MNETIHNALCACLGLTPDSPQALAMVRQAYTEPENSPRPARSMDVVYWSLSPEGGERPVSYDLLGPFGHNPVVHRYLPYQLLVVCYGPGCEANAQKIRSFLYVDGAGFPRQILRKAGIYPVPDPPAIQLLYEPEGSLWRRRADAVISLRIRETLVHPVKRGAIQSAPTISLTHD